MNQEQLFEAFAKFQLSQGGFQGQGSAKAPIRENFGASHQARHSERPSAPVGKKPEETPCYHFNRPGGCKRGVDCKYLHDSPDLKLKPVNLAQQQMDEERKFLLSRLAMLDAEKAQSSAPAKAPAKATANAPAKAHAKAPAKAPVQARVHFEEVSKPQAPGPKAQAKGPAPTRPPPPIPQTLEERELAELKAKKAKLTREKEIADLRAENAALEAALKGGK